MEKDAILAAFDRLAELVTRQHAETQQRFGVIEGELTSLKGQVVDLAAKVEVIDSKVEALDSKVESLDAKVDSHHDETQAALAELSTRVGHIERDSEVGELKGRVEEQSRLLQLLLAGRTPRRAPAV